MTELLLLARSPRRGAEAVLARGTLPTAAVLILVATAVAAVNAARFAADVPVSSVLFGDTRSPAIAALIDSLGRDRAAIVAYLIEQSWTAVVVVTALSPLLVWLLGASAVQAAARLDGARRPFRPILVLIGYATALTRIPADGAAALMGSGQGAGPQVAQLIGTAGLVWLAIIAWRAIELHYGLPQRRALIELLIAVVVFYLVPIVLIVASVFVLIVAAIVLEYVPR
ncbi:MAG TPA: YIP1 family protein [Candidatus Limnocylindria bacterium]|nr:YIP1 family protein [Candidatus Limnocylindria bacterium]